jgi:phosphatidylglycerol:prolipoprotein diacylglycerol transferase
VSSPWTIQLGSLVLSAHVLFELCAYVAGFLLMARARRTQGDAVDSDGRWRLSAAALLGAAVGSKLVHWGEHLPELLAHGDALAWMGGKSIVGGLIGGTLAVEVTKSVMRVEARTGDVLVVPLCVSMMIGRVGCFVSGLADDTYGTPTALPWGVDFGDGIPRHPTQLYEIVFLALLAFLLSRRRALGWAAGERFDAFFCAYLAFRVGVDFLKPYASVPAGFGLAATQWAALGGILWRVRWRARRSLEFLPGVSR